VSQASGVVGCGVARWAWADGGDRFRFTAGVR
jgi:hypothetical protein